MEHIKFGGLTGDLNPNSFTKYCYNIGTVNSSGLFVGGLIGILNSDNLVGNIINCYCSESSFEKACGSDLDLEIMKSDEEIKGFTNELGEEFVYEENSYPKLKWEKTIKE